MREDRSRLPQDKFGWQVARTREEKSDRKEVKTVRTGMTGKGIAQTHVIMDVR